MESGGQIIEREGPGAEALRKIDFLGRLDLAVDEELDCGWAVATSFDPGQHRDRLSLPGGCWRRDAIDPQVRVADPGKSQDIDRHALERGLRGLVDGLADIFGAVGDEHDAATATERQGSGQAESRVDVAERGIDLRATGGDRGCRIVAEEIASGSRRRGQDRFSAEIHDSGPTLERRGGQCIPQPAIRRIARLGADAVGVVDDEDHAARRRS